MKKIHLLLIIFLQTFMFAQTTPSYKNVKLTALPLGIKSDSVALWNGSTKLLKHIPLSQISAPTNLTATANPSGVTVFSSTGNDAVLPIATTVDAGLLMPSDKVKLNNQSGINTGDQDLSIKQNTLVSGTNIKTINGGSLLGPGNIATTSEISIQNSVGSEQFKVTDVFKFDNVTFDSANKKISVDALSTLSVFYDGINGDDATARLENAKKPFKTINALLLALPATTGETYTIYILNGNVSFTRKITRRNLKFISFVDTSFIFDGVKENDGVTNAAFLFSDSAGVDRTWTFETSNINISCSRSFQFGREFNTGVVFKGVINDFYWAAGAFYIQPNTNLKINTMTNFGGTITSSGNNVAFAPSYVEVETLNYTNNVHVINQYKGTLRINNLIKTNIGTASEVTFSVNNSATNEITLEFKNITHNGNIVTYVNQINFLDCRINSLATFNFGRINGLPQTIVTGNLIGTTFQDNGYFGNGAYFKNFTGRVGGATLANGVYTFENSNITCNTTLTNRWSAATLKEAVFFKGYNTVTQLVTGGGLIGAEADTTVEFGGVVKTNANSFGTKVKSVYINSTFKEKIFEVVIRSKSDLVNRVLSSGTTYIIDGNIILLTGEYIEVPVGGLTISGYGFDVSIITKNVPGQSIFKSPAGGSGNFVTSNIQYNSGSGSVFDLLDSDGTHAIEINDVNFQSCTSLGTLNRYRQFTGTTVGIYGCSDGLTLEGIWNGFKLTNTNAFSFGASGTLIKKGATTSFSNRLYLDLNLSLPTGAKICDFQESNFTSDKLLQIVNCLVKVNGVIDPTTTSSTFPNMTPFSTKSYFTNNIGIKNSFNEPYGLKTTNLQSYANDSAAASGGIQIGEVYVESSTGYFKTRQL